MTLILGNDLVWWTGVLGGFFFLLLIVTALVKQFNWKIFMRSDSAYSPTPLVWLVDFGLFINPFFNGTASI
jgi:hypothetical protein